jgi:hypothetical protein
MGTKVFTIMDTSQGRRSRKRDKMRNSLAFGRRPAHDHGMADDGDPVEDRPPGGAAWPWPRSGWPLAFCLLIGLLVAGLVIGRFTLAFLENVFDALPLGRCGCGVEPPPPERSWYQAPAVHTIALALAPFAAMALYQLVGSVLIYLNRRPAGQAAVLIIIAGAGAFAISWVLIGFLGALLV